MNDCLDCDSCLEIEGVACYAILSITAGLTPDTDYSIFITDRHGNQFRQEVTTDEDGDFTLDLTAFDEGMFTENSGTYTLTASTSALMSTEETFVVGYTEYSCIKIKFLDIA